jgi:NAD(P)H-flavin reductase
MSSAFGIETVLDVRHWTDDYFSFTTTRDDGFRFDNGQFVMIGLQGQEKPLMRAYDVRTGKVLAKRRLPAGAQTTPMTFISPRSGRQYVVVMAGGHGSLGTKLGDSLVAFALPANAAH